MSFSNIIGQNRAIKILDKAIKSERLAHAYIFVGSFGIGKRLVANELAKRLNCDTVSKDNKDDVYESCDECVKCKNIDENIYPNVITVQSEGASISIGDIRNVQKTIQYKQTSTGYRCVIIDEAEKMTDEAANCFLKTLEEPPLGTMIILVTSSVSRMLKTIVSRCQVLKFRDLLDKEKIEIINKICNVETGHGVSNGDYEENDIKNALYLSGGSIKGALDYLEDNEEGELEEFIKLEKMLEDKDINSDMHKAFESLSKDKDKFKTWVNFLIEREERKNLDQDDLPFEQMNFLLQIKRYLNRNVNPRVIWAWMISKKAESLESRVQSQMINY